MKNSKEYANKVVKFFKTCKVAKANPPKFADPVEALIFGILSEAMPDNRAKHVYTAMQKGFVDWNDLRVSRLEEISETLGEDVQMGERLTSNITSSLNHVFRGHDTVSLEMLREMGKRQARKFLGDMPGVSRFVADYVMLTSLGAHSIPLTAKMQDYLKNAGLVEASATEDEIEGFLERQISASNAFQFYATLRKESERPGGEKAMAKKLVKVSNARASTGHAGAITKKKAH
jgi:endonuclease III